MRAVRPLSVGRVALLAGAALAPLLLGGIAAWAQAALAGPLAAQMSSPAAGIPAAARVAARQASTSARSHSSAPTRSRAKSRTPPPAAHAQQPVISAPPVATPQPSTSPHWAGYATTGTTYTSVTGAWTQPRPTCQPGETAFSAFWVGLDGDISTTVEQIGTESDCDRGTPSYAAWYELFPAPPVPIQHAVAAGDSLSASVTATTSDAFTLQLSDATQHWTFTTGATVSGAPRSSAEWIAEPPSNGRRTAPLANFGTVTFTQCDANGHALNTNPNLDAITLANGRGGAEAKPSGLSSTGTGFSITAQPGALPGPGGGAPFPTGPHHGRHHHRRHEGGGWPGGPPPRPVGNPYPGPGGWGPPPFAGGNPYPTGWSNGNGR